MLWALKQNKRTVAVPKQNATCPICNNDVISKCGEIKVWHWAHKSNKDCDDWYEPESEWHKNWKNEFPIEQQEFTMGRHRADIRTKDRWIIELQNSSISSEEITERENYYKRMIWLLNGETLCKGLELRKKKQKVLCLPIEKGAFQDFDERGKIHYSKYTGVETITFRWKHPPKSWWFTKKEIYIDLEDYIFLIKKIYPKTPCGGWGVLLTREEFLKKFV